MKSRNYRLAQAQIILLMSAVFMSIPSVLADETIIDDFVINDDLVLVGSACVGGDCNVGGESFGYETINLKENNLRIKFEDTSSSLFPFVDWQITINDSSQGGLNHFSIEDVDAKTTPFTILADAPTNSLHIAPSGNLGLGTAAPLVSLHMVVDNTPTVRLEQTGESGWGAQTWDMGGNETNFFIRDHTNGDRLPFRIISGAPSESLYINVNGYIGLKTSAPGGLFDVRHSANPANHAFLISPTSAVGVNIDKGLLPRGVFDVHTDGESKFTVHKDGKIGIGVSNVYKGVLEAKNGAHLSIGGVWMNSSSRALKSDIVGISAVVALETINALKPVTFAYKNEPDETYAGFIAEDVPEIVASGARNSLAAMDFVAVLTKMVQEQQKAIAELQRRVQQLTQNKSAEQ
jgi:hypothetical protein